MNRTKLWLAVWSAVALSCNDTPGPQQDEVNRFDMGPFAGMYVDTIPVPGAVGNIVQLTIHDDSTFSMLQRVMKLNDPVIKPVATAGTIEFLDNGQKWKLVAKNTGASTWWLSQVDGVFTFLDSMGNAYSEPSAYRLQRISSATAQIGHDRLFSMDKGQVRFPLGVYNRPAGGTINVASYYLKNCSEAELALCYAYTRMFEGKLEGQDPFALVLQKDGASLQAMVDRNVFGLEGSAWKGEKRQDVLTSLILSKSTDGMVVTYTFLDAKDDNWIAKDVYTFKDGKMTLTAKGSIDALNR